MRLQLSALVCIMKKMNRVTTNGHNFLFFKNIQEVELEEFVQELKCKKILYDAVRILFRLNIFLLGEISCTWYF